MIAAPRYSIARAATAASWLVAAGLAFGSLLAAAIAADAPYVSYALKHARAADIEPTLGGLLGPDAKQTRVVVDVRANQLLVSAPPHVHRLVAELVRKLDVPAVRSDVPAASGLAPRPNEGAPADRYVKRSVTLKHATAANVEAVLANLLGARLEPRTGRGVGLNAYELATPRGARVEVEFDNQQGQVLARGPERTVNELAELIAALDAPRQSAGQTLRVVPLGKADRAKLRQAIDAYRGTAQPGANRPPAPEGAPQVPTPNGSNPGLRPAQPPRAAPGPRDQGLIDRATGRAVTHLLLQEPARPIELEDVPLQSGDRPTIVVEPGAQPTIVVPAPQGVAAQEAAQQAADDRLRELGTAVDVEALPDLDVIILRGSERDVNELVRIIQEIERISAESVPQVEVIQLKHVASDAVAKVITQIQPELLAGRQGRASATALVKPNALLLIGWGEALTALAELVGKLDQPVGPETQFRVFRLKHAAAVAARTTIQDFFKERTGLGPKVILVADARSNSLIVQAGPRDLAEVELLIARLDTPQSGAVNQLRVFRLNNSLAADLAPVIQEAISASAGSKAGGTAASGTGANAERSAALEFLTVDTRGQQLIKSGVLADVRITPDPRTNTLLVSAPAESMDLLAALIRQLDDQPAAVAQVKVFRIVNGDAGRLVEMLRSLLGSQTAAGPMAPVLAGAEGEGSLAPLRFSVDVRTNSIIASGSAGDLTIVEAILLRLDESDAQFRKNAIYRLKNAFAPDVAQAINEFLRSERRVQQSAPGGVSAYRQIESEVVVVPEIVSNSLILSATPRYFDEIQDLIEDLDAQPPQVMIQVLIAEVALNNVDEFGIELGLQDSVLFDRSLLGSLVTTTNSIQTSTPAGIVTDTNEIIQGATNEPGFDFNSPILPNSGSDRSLLTAGAVGGQGLSNFGVGRVNTELGYGGLVLSASSENVSLLVRALRECRRLDVLSRPQVMTLDNQPAFIQVGQRVPRITNVNITQFGQNSAVELFNVGLILGVTPRISPDGLVVMEVDAEKSAIGPIAEGIPVSFAPNGDAILSPRVDVTTAQTTVSAADGQTIVLGGLITRSQRTVNRRVPYLSSVPVLGFLFRYDQFIGQRTELIIILTPHVIRSEADAERIKQLESSRMSWCLGDAEKLQGDMGIHPRGSCEHCDVETKVIYPDRDPRGMNPTIIDPEFDQSGPELVPPGNSPPMPNDMPTPPLNGRPPPPGEFGPTQGPLVPSQGSAPRGGKSNQPAPGAGRPVVTPVTKLSRPTRLPPVVQSNSPLTAAGQAAHMAPRNAPPLNGQPLNGQHIARAASAVRPAGYVDRPDNSATRRVVTGKHPPGGIIPGGASEYLPKPVEKK